MNQINFSINTPNLSFQSQLKNLLESIKIWKNLSGYDQEDAIETFMTAIGKLYLDFFQYHLDQANTIGTEYAADMEWALRPINVSYVYKLWSRLTNSDDWADVWEVACWGMTNIEAFNAMFSNVVPELDAGSIVEYLEDRKKQEWLDPTSIPKKVPQTHWWWFSHF